MFSDKDVGLLGDYISEMLDCLNNLLLAENTDFNAGQTCAYLHILRLIQGMIFDDDLKKSLGLDIDLDKKYIK